MRPPQAAALVAVIGVLTVGLVLLLRIDPPIAPSSDPALPAALDPEPEVGVAPALGAPSVRSEPDVASSAGERSPLVGGGPFDPEAGPLPDAAGARVTGRVVGSFGQPVADARVFAAPAGLVDAIDTLGDDSPWVFRRRDTQSGADGRFELPLVGSGGQIQIAVRARGFAPLRARRSWTGAPPFDVGDLVLESSVLLSGHVLDSSGRGVGDAELHAAPIEGLEAVLVLQDAQGTLVGTTDSGGGFQLDELAAGRFSIEVRHPDHPSETFEGVTEAPGEVRGGIVVILERGASISGRVEGIPPGQHANYVVHAGTSGFGGIMVAGSFDLGRRAELDPDGAFLLRGLRPGREVSLKVLEAEGVGPFGKALSSTVPATAGDSGVVLTLKSGLTLSFRVVEAPSGRPVSEFDVDVGAPWPQAVRDADGKRLSHHPEGVFRQEGIDVQGGVDSVIVRIGSDRHLPWEQSVPLPAGWEINLGTIRLEAAPMIRVRVVDAETGAGVRGARVTLSAANPDGEGQGIFRGAAPLFASDGEARRGRTDADGRVVLAAVADGPCVLKASHKAYADHPGEEVGPQAPGAEHVLRLSRGGRVEVIVLEADGQPREGARVRHQAPSSSALPTGWGGGMRTTGADGRVTYTNLTAGVHRFRIAADARQGVGGFVPGATVVIAGDGPGSEDESWEELTVLDGATLELTLISAQRGSLAGRVSEGGRNLAGARVSLVPADEGDGGPPHQALALLGGGGPHAETDGSGRYELEEITIGDYLLRVSHPTRTMVSEFEVQVSAAAGRFDVDLDLAVIEGRISDGDGNPLVGARVEVSEATPQGRGTGQRRMRIMSVFSSGEQVTFGSGLGDATASTDAEGRYRLRGVVSGIELVVKARIDGRQPARSEPVRLGADETRSEVDLVLAGAGAIRLRVVDAAGEPASFCVAQASFKGEAEHDVSDVDQFIQDGGSALLDGLRPGPWEVAVRKVGFGNPNSGPPPESEPQRVEVREGEVRELELRLP